LTDQIDLTTGIFPVKKSSSKDITIYTTKTDGWGKCPWTVGTGKTSCVGGSISTKKITYYERGWEMGSDNPQCTTRAHAQKTYTKYTCTYFDYWEEIGEYSSKRDYLRGDGTTFTQNHGFIYRIIR
jgi:hypothetical protein